MINTARIQDVCGIKIYPMEYFCPINYKTGKMIITPNTRTIHHYAASWISQSTYRKHLFSQKHLRLLRFRVLCKHLLNGTRPI